MNKKNFGISKYLITNIIVVFAIIILIALFQFASSDKYTDNVTMNNNSNVPRLTEEDRKFQDWTNLLSDNMKNDLYCIAKAAENRNLTDTEICGRFLKENSNRSLRQISEFNVSPSFEMTVSEYKKSLELYYLGGKNLEIGAKNYDTELMANATEYINQGKKKMTAAHYFLGLVS